MNLLQCKIEFYVILIHYLKSHGIFTRGYATRDNTPFSIHSMKYNSLLHWKKNPLYVYEGITLEM